MGSDQPPRPLMPGDVVATFSEFLGEWTAAQITGLNPAWQRAGVLELDWSGPEPATVADLGRVVPLRRAHHGYARRPELAHVNLPWLLPRGYKIIGRLPLLHDRPSNAYAMSWETGRHLAMQRRWDSGDHGYGNDPGEIECTGAVLGQGQHRGVFSLKVTDTRSLDCEHLVTCYPDLADLALFGELGTLVNADSLNQLGKLRRLIISGLFGMTRTDCLLPSRATALEQLSLYNIPHDYAAAMRARWRPEIVNGTMVSITGARKPEWITENRDNPLRDWDTRQHISRARYAQAVAQYKATRQAVHAALSDGQTSAERFCALGRDYGEAFNKLDLGQPFIETVEREDLFRALMYIIDEAAAQAVSDPFMARDNLIAGLESVRKW